MPALIVEVVVLLLGEASERSFRVQKGGGTGNSGVPYEYQSRSWMHMDNCDQLDAQELTLFTCMLLLC